MNQADQDGSHRDLNNFLIDLLKRHKGLTLSVNKETSIAEKLLQAGIPPKLILEFLKKNFKLDSDILELGKDSIDREEYYKNKLILNSVEALILFIEKSL